MDNRFIIYVDKFLGLRVPYSDHVFQYDNIEEALKDLNYCLQYELSKKGEKINAPSEDEKKKR